MNSLMWWGQVPQVPTKRLCFGVSTLSPLAQASSGGRIDSSSVPPHLIKRGRSERPRQVNKTVPSICHSQAVYIGPHKKALIDRWSPSLRPIVSGVDFERRLLFADEFATNPTTFSLSQSYGEWLVPHPTSWCAVAQGFSPCVIHLSATRLVEQSCSVDIIRLHSAIWIMGSERRSSALWAPAGSLPLQPSSLWAILRGRWLGYESRWSADTGAKRC